MSTRKIPLRNFKTELALIFKKRLDELGYSTWKQLTDKLGLNNPRSFIDFFNGRQCLSKEIIEKTFEILDIPKELIDLYAEPIIKYRIRINDDTSSFKSEEERKQHIKENRQEYQHNYYMRVTKRKRKEREK